MATCKDCIHEKLCVIKAFPDAFENTQWDKEPCDHFLSTADVVPKSEVVELEKALAKCLPSYCQVMTEKKVMEIGRSQGAKTALLELKKQVHDHAVYTNSQDIPNYVNLKVFDAILNNLIKRYMEGENVEQVSQ